MKKVKKLGASPGGGDSLARYRAANGERQNLSHSQKSVFLYIAHHPLDQGNKKGPNNHKYDLYFVFWQLSQNVLRRYEDWRCGVLAPVGKQRIQFAALSALRPDLAILGGQSA